MTVLPAARWRSSVVALLALVATPGCDGAGARVTQIVPAPPPDVLPAKEWKKRFDAAEAFSAPIVLAKSLSADSWQLYESGYSWEGYVSMYEATGETRYLDEMLTYTANWIASSLPCEGIPGNEAEVGFRCWLSGGAEYPLYESYGWRFVAKLLHLMRDQPGYSAQFRDLLAFTESSIWDKWYSRGPRSTMYRENAHMASHWAYIALYLAQVTQSEARRQQCLTVLNDISHLGLPNHPGNSLRSQVIDSPVAPGASFWNYDWGQTARPGSDVNHGEAVVTFAIAAHEAGMAQWSGADMGKLVRLLDDVIWPTAGVGAYYVDGTGTGTGWLHGYAKLGRFDVALQKRLESHPPGLDSIWHCGNMAANAALLRGGVD